MSSPQSADPSTAEDIWHRDLLVDAHGEIVIPLDGPGQGGHPDEDDAGDDDYMKLWFVDNPLRAAAIGTIELPVSVIVASPERLSDGDECAARSGTYTVVGIEVPENRLGMPAAILRYAGERIVGWRYLGMADDDNYVIVPRGASVEGIAFPERPPSALGASEWILLGRTADERPFVWITNPTGSGMRAFAGVAADGAAVALFVQLY